MEKKQSITLGRKILAISDKISLTFDREFCKLALVREVFPHLFVDSAYQSKVRGAESDNLVLS